MVDGQLATFRASDGYQWYYRRYRPNGPVRGRVVFVHGIQSHGGWYTATCAALCAAGYDVSFLDRRGCGLNTAHRGDAPGFFRLIDDIAEYLRHLRGGEPGTNWRTPLTLAGISWGGKLVVGLCYRYPQLVDRLALLCPGFCARVSPPLRLRFAILWSRWFRAQRRFAIPLSDPQLFTASPAWQQFIAHDPHALHTGTARLLFASAQLDFFLLRACWGVRVPTLLLLAQADRIIDNRATRRYINRFRTPARTVIEYPQAHHTLEFEPEPARFRDDLLHWLHTSERD